MAADIGIRIGVDGEKAFKSALNGVNAQLKNLNSEMKAAVSAMAGIDDAETSTAKKSDILSRSIEASKQKIQLISKEYDRAKSALADLSDKLDQAKQEFGENSNEALKAQNAYNRQAAAVNRLGAQLNDATADMNRMEAELKDLSSAADKAERSFANFGSKGFTVAKGALASLVADGIRFAIDGIKSLASEAITAADSLTKFESTMSFAGFDAAKIEASKQAVQDYAARTVYDLETVANTTAQLAANGVADYQALTEAAGNLNAVAGGNADTFSSVAMVLTQTAGAGKLTTENWNQLADAIPGASGKLQEAMLANGAYTGSFRDAMAEGQITAEEFNQAIMQLGMSDFAIEAASSVTTIEGAVGNLKAVIVEGLTSLLADGGMGAITGFINGIANTLKSAGQYIGPAIETIKSAVSGIGEAFKNAFTDSQQSAILGFFQRLGPALVGLPFQAVAAVVQVLSGALQVLVNIGGAVVNFFSGLPGSINTVSAGFSALASAVSGALSGALQSAIAWGSNMVSQARSAMQNVVTSIGSTLRGAVSTVTSIGRNIVQGLANGIRGAASAVVNALKGVVQSAVNAAKAALGIASPSKTFKRIGGYVMDGFVIGVKSGVVLAVRSMRKSMETISETALRLANTLNDRLVAKENELVERLKAEELEDATKEALTKQLDAVKEFRSEYEKALDAVLDKRETMTGKLKDFGNLFSVVDSEIGEFFFLGDLQKDIDAINAYSAALEGVKKRGATDSLLAEIAGLSVDDATKYTQHLLAMTDEEFDSYIALWEEKQKLASDVASRFYKEELGTLVNTFVDAVPDELDVMHDDLRFVGRHAAEGLAQGIIDRQSAVIEAAKAVAAAARNALQTAEQIHSPSEKWAVLGDYMAQGIGVGFSRRMSSISKSITSSIPSAASQVAQLSSGVVNGIQTAMAGAGQGGSYTINLLLPDGQQLARYQLPHLIDVARANGTPILNPT